MCLPRSLMVAVLSPVPTEYRREPASASCSWHMCHPPPTPPNYFGIHYELDFWVLGCCRFWKKGVFAWPFWGVTGHSLRSWVLDCRADFCSRVEHFVSRPDVGSWATQVKLNMCPQDDWWWAQFSVVLFCRPNSSTVCILPCPHPHPQNNKCTLLALCTSALHTSSRKIL